MIRFSDRNPQTKDAFCLSSVFSLFGFMVLGVGSAFEAHGVPTPMLLIVALIFLTVGVGMGVLARLAPDLWRRGLAVEEPSVRVQRERNLAPRPAAELLDIALALVPSDHGQERCPFCHDGLGGAVRTTCAFCASDLHLACLPEAGHRCPTLGCRGRSRNHARWLTAA